MTHEEITEAGQKFIAYLDANGQRVVALTIGFGDGTVSSFGTQESIEDALLKALAHWLGYTLEMKP